MQNQSNRIFNSVAGKFSENFAIGLLAIGVGGMGLSTSAEADILANYNFTGGSTASAVSPANATASSVAWNGVGGTTGFSSSSGTAFSQSVNIPSALNTNQYIGFTLSAAAGYELDLSSLSFRLGNQHFNGVAQYTTSTSVRTSVDNFASNVTLSSGGPVVSFSNSSNTNTTVFMPYSASLAGAEYQSLNSIEIRVYPFDNAQTTVEWLRYDDLVLEGVVSEVPEPGALSLLAMGGLCLIRRRRKHA